MKKIYFLAALLAGMAFTACENDEIGVELKEAGQLTITVNPSDFFSRYNYEDTYHNINTAELYRTFNSRLGYFIELRAMIYNQETDELVDSVVVKTLTNVNSYTTQKPLDLEVGKYTVVSTLSFNVENNGTYISMWNVADREKLSTANMRARSRANMWCILSVATDDVEIKPGQTTTLSATPHPVGSLVYALFENFQYTNEASYGTPDNKSLKQVALYTRRTAISYNLSPKAVSKVNYLNEGTSNQWKALTGAAAGSDGYIKNTVSYSFLLEPEETLVFGLTRVDETSFTPYGETSAKLEAGKVYLAYWDHLKLGAPYFGIADNNHFNTYTKK